MTGTVFPPDWPALPRLTPLPTRDRFVNPDDLRRHASLQRTAQEAANRVVQKVSSRTPGAFWQLGLYGAGDAPDGDLVDYCREPPTRAQICEGADRVPPLKPAAWDLGRVFADRRIDRRQARLLAMIAGYGILHASSAIELASLPWHIPADRMPPRHSDCDRPSDPERWALKLAADLRHLQAYGLLYIHRRPTAQAPIRSISPTRLGRLSKQLVTHPGAFGWPPEWLVRGRLLASDADLFQGWSAHQLLVEVTWLGLVMLAARFPEFGQPRSLMLLDFWHGQTGQPPDLYTDRTQLAHLQGRADESLAYLLPLSSAAYESAYKIGLDRWASRAQLKERAYTFGSAPQHADAVEELAVGLRTEHLLAGSLVCAVTLLTEAAAKHALAFGCESDLAEPDLLAVLRMGNLEATFAIEVLTQPTFDDPARDRGLLDDLAGKLRALWRRGGPQAPLAASVPPALRSPTVAVLLPIHQSPGRHRLDHVLEIALHVRAEMQADGTLSPTAGPFMAGYLEHALAYGFGAPIWRTELGEEKSVVVYRNPADGVRAVWPAIEHDWTRLNLGRGRLELTRFVVVQGGAGRHWEINLSDGDGEHLGEGDLRWGLAGTGSPGVMERMTGMDPSKAGRRKGKRLLLGALTAGQMRLAIARSKRKRRSQG